jgi:hypothetical protein
LFNRQPSLHKVHSRRITCQSTNGFLSSYRSCVIG